VERLTSDSEIGVKKFDSAGVLLLLRESIKPASRCVFSEETAEWIDGFWNSFDELPGPSNPQSLADLPLLRLYHGREYVSLDLCRLGCLVSSTDLTIELAGIAIKLGILVIQTPPRIFSDSLEDKVFSLKAFLECLNYGNLSLEALSLRERNQVANWIESQSPRQLQILSPTLKTTAARLPLWPAKKGSDAVKLLPAEDITMLPPNIPSDIISKFLGSDVAVATYSKPLDDFLSNVANRQRMHSSALIERLRLPTVLHASELDDFRALLNIMFRFPSQTLMVPDGNLMLTPASQLYDHSIELISSALQSREATSFVHIGLRDLQPQLRGYGLQYEVTFNVFLACAREIDQVHNNDDISDGAERAYGCYNSELPSRIMTNANQWRMLDNLRFIPRLTGRRPRLEELYEVTMYCKEVPAIAAPRELLREKFEAVAWTQRGIFREQPQADLIAVNPSLGQPRAEEVVGFTFSTPEPSTDAEFSGCPPPGLVWRHLL
jgi:sacsin